VPLCHSYYPVNAAAYLKDANSQFTLLVDRSEAGASINDGSVEFMVHRRLL
jgi:lysosomal alpha-mannosidase